MAYHSNIVNRLLRLISKGKADNPLDDDDFRAKVMVKASTLEGIRAELDARAKVEPNVAFMRDFTKEVVEKYFTTTSRNLMAHFTDTMNEKYSDEMVQLCITRLEKLDKFLQEDLGITSEMERVHLMMSSITSSFMNVEMKRRKAPLTN